MVNSTVVLEYRFYIPGLIKPELNDTGFSTNRKNRPRTDKSGNAHPDASA